MLNNDLMDEIVESVVELDVSDVVEPDNVPPQEMGDPSVEVTEENREAALLLKSIAMDAVLEGQLEKAVSHLTKAITLNPKSPILYASRASVFVKLKKPNAAIRDADAALKINADFAKGYKARGMSRVQLGLWEEAAKDLCMVLSLDFDEETGVILKKVESNVRKIIEHRKKYELLHRERERRKIELERTRLLHEAEFAGMLKDGELMVIKSASDLKTKLNAASNLSRLSVLYFSARWCGPCRYLDPLCANLAAKYPKVVFLKVDIDDATAAAIEWRIETLPCFILSKNGIRIDAVSDMNMNSLEEKIIRHVG